MARATIDPLAPLAGADGTANDAPLDEPELRREGLDLVLEWPDGPRFELRTVHDGSDGVHGQLGVFYGGRRQAWGNIMLASVSTRGAWRKLLESSVPAVPSWREYLEEAAFRLTQAAREGEPGEILTGAPAPSSRELLPGVLYESEVTVLAGDGDAGKSMTTLAIAVAMETGVGLPGRLPTRRVHVGILDWETDKATANARMGLLAAGLGVDPPPIYYKRMSSQLYENARPLAADLAREGVGLVIVDSQQFAIASGDGAAFHEGAIQFFGALRLFAPAAVLVVNHLTNADARNGSAGRPFGGAFAFNGPRIVWTAQRDRNIEDATAITFVNIKANNLPRRPDPFGLRFQPGDGTITCHPFDLAEAAPQTTAGASLPYRIRLALAKGALTIAELSEQLDAKEETVRRSLTRMKGQALPISEGKPQRWGLAQS